MQATDRRIAVHRVTMVGLGGIAGLALWALGRQWGSPGMPPALFLALFTYVTTLASVALALCGPIEVPRALRGGALSAVFVTALISLAGQRYVVATELLEDPVMLSVATVMVLYLTPFLIVWMRDRRQWRRYASLFDAAWTMVMRYTIAWVFVAIFWLVAFLSDALLDLVDVTVIDWVLRTDWVRFAVSGAILGLGLAVVHELRGTLSPYLALRLLRLFVPVVLAVVALFLAAVPFRGLSQLFGEFSAAATLMGVAVMAITLISTALDQNDRVAVQSRGLRLATRALAVLLPLLTALAIWAVALRVRQYGWTPDRILAGLVALFLLAYGLGYCIAVLGGGAWMRRIRSINVAMALAVIAVSALWMTPALDVHRLSANSQLDRFLSGRSTLDELALWQMGHQWGRAGQAGLQRLEAMTDHADHAALVARIADVRTQVNPFQFEQAARRRAAPDQARALLALMPVRPENVQVPPLLLAAAPPYRLQRWLEGCRRSLPDGRAGCVLVQGPFTPSADQREQGILLYLDAQGRGRADHLVLRPEGKVTVRDVFDPVANDWPDLPPAAVAQALDGGFRIAPSGSHALFLGGSTLAPGQ